MNKITVSLFVVSCVLLLTWTFASPLDRDTNLDLNGQDKDQESNLLAQFQNTMKRARAQLSEGQQPYSELEEIVDKDSLSEDKSLIQEPMMSKRKKAKCLFNCGCSWWNCG